MNYNNKAHIQELIESVKTKDTKKILFVCLGNICRSPAAEGVLRDIVKTDSNPDSWVIDSAGTGNWHIGQTPDKRMKIHARRRGIELDHYCRQITFSDFDDFDLIIGMDSMNLEHLRHVAPSVEAARKIIPMSVFLDESWQYDHIPDPYYSGSEGFELVLDLLENGCRKLYNLLR